MANKVLDLDALIPEDIVLKLGGELYKIPADMSLETTGKLIALGRSLAEDPKPETVKEFETFITDILSVRQAPPQALKMTLTQALAIVKAVTSAGEELADKARPFVS